MIVALTGAAHAAVPASAEPTAARAVATDEPVPGKLLLMLDASGSMKAKDPSGLTKIEAAKKALTGVVGALPDTAQVGLRVYGATVDGKGKPTPAACADTQLIHPIAALDKPKLTSTIAAIKALGETPIAHSLTEALTDLGTEGKRNIVLVSDGEESCVPTPAPSSRNSPQQASTSRSTPSASASTPKHAPNSNASPTPAKAPTTTPRTPPSSPPA